MTISRVTRVANPRRKAKRKLSLKQKLHFGNPRQRSAARAALKKKRANPKKSARKARRNPPHLVTLGLINPQPARRRARKKKSNMATKTKKRRTAKSNPRRRRQKKNSIIVVRKARRVNPARKRHKARRSNPRHARRNPALFGRQVTAFELTKAIAGGLVGVAITKAVPNFLPASLTSSSQFVNVGISAAVAIGAGMLAKTLIKSDPTIGDAILFGGLMQAGSVAINTFIPSVGTYIGLHGLGNGMGDLVAGRFPVPMNPISAGQQAIAAAAAVPAASHGVGAIYTPFGKAF